MTIETKYDIEDKVWFMHNNSVKCETIIRIDTATEKDMNCTGTRTTTMYYYYLYDYHAPYLESELFPTKEELLKSL